MVKVSSSSSEKAKGSKRRRKGVAADRHVVGRVMGRCAHQIRIRR